MEQPTTTNGYYADLVANLRVLCDDFHHAATLRAEIAAAYQRIFTTPTR